MHNNKTRQLTFTGVFAALIFIATFAFHIPTGISGGYIHVGDAFIYLAACMLPRPLAMAASAVGAGLSDLFTPGAAVWVLPTAIIKPLCCLGFTGESEKMLCKRNALATLVAGIITTLGYGAATLAITGSFAVAVGEMPFQVIQSVGSAVCFAAIAATVEKTGLKNAIRLKGDRI